MENFNIIKELQAIADELEAEGWQDVPDVDDAPDLIDDAVYDWEGR